MSSRVLLPDAKAVYDQRDEFETRAIIQDRLSTVRDGKDDVELTKGQKIIMRDADNKRWQLNVSTTGALIITAA